MTSAKDKWAVEASRLSYRYPSGEPVLREVELRVPDGSIYGFLGPNGAGKTTTLRLLLGLLRRQEGTIRLRGRPLDTDRAGIMGRVGSLIETPSLYAHLTAEENLEVWRLIYGTSPSRVRQVLALVGLAEVGRKRAGQFSLGMRQRLAVAVALLHDPLLLILDEPTNGLDPHGIVDMRELLTTLNRAHGVTVVVSSHLLAEVEKLATHIGVIHQGEMRFQGTVEELAGRRGSCETVLATDDNARAVEVLTVHGITARLIGGKIQVGQRQPDQLIAIHRHLAEAGIGLFEMAPPKDNLEATFMSLIGERPNQ